MTYEYKIRKKKVQNSNIAEAFIKCPNDEQEKP